MKSNDLISRAGVLRMLDENGVVFRGEIEKMPAVDAIPVEWLKKLCDSYDYNLFYSIPLKQVLKSWKIEKQLQNERRDGE